MKNFFITFIFIFMLFILSGCGDKQTGPINIKWDRDACDRCQMMLSDRNFSAQIRVFPKDKRSRIFRFDDVGCASLWLASPQQQQWQGDKKTEFWVTDVKTGEWINAKIAWYIKDQHTPMNYGLGAVSSKQENALDFEQAKIHIINVENKLNIHGGNFKH
jgi:copper chaperone NosL